MKFTKRCREDRPERFQLFIRQLRADGAQVLEIKEFPTGTTSGRYEKHIVFDNATCAIANTENKVITVKFLRPSNLYRYNFTEEFHADIYEKAYRNEAMGWNFFDK